MANLQNFRNNQRPSWIAGIGQKVKNAAEFAGAVKGIYDVSRTVFRLYGCCPISGNGNACWFMKLKSIGYNIYNVS